MLMFLCYNMRAQTDKKRDYVWALGYNFTPKVAFNKIDFNDNKVKLLPEITFTDTIGFLETNASICDKNGKLLFYTNGIDIRGRTNRIVNNSQDFNYQQGVVVLNGGFRGLQNCMILPKPQTEDTFFLFHKVTKTFYTPINRSLSDGMYITKIYAKDTVTNTIYKQHKISDDTLNYNELTAVRHANGIDWWIINAGFK